MPRVTHGRNGAATELSPQDLVLSKLGGVKQQGRGHWMALCPAHDDHHPSLSVTLADDGKIMLYCHARCGCSTEAITRAAGLALSDLFPPRPGEGHKKRAVAYYDYTDEQGELLFQTVRFVPKDFRQRRPDPSREAGWAWNLDGVRLVLYRLPHILDAIAAKRVIYLVEGERDADRLADRGLDATTAPLGAGKWRDEYAQSLVGAKVVILPDNDVVGKAHAHKAAASIAAVGAKVKVLELPGLLPKGDVSDWLAAGGTVTGLYDLRMATASWTPGQAKTAAVEVEVPEAEPWPEPVPLSDVPEVPAFPVEVFPLALVGLCGEIAAALPCPVDFPGLCMLCMAGGALGNRRHLAITRTHIQAPSLFGAYIGSPGTKKTAPFKILQAPFVQVQTRWLADWKEKMKRWKNQEPNERGDKPAARRCLTEDYTMESLMPTLEDNPEGMLIARNEVSAIMTSMNQYKGGSGSDRQMLLNLWDGVPYFCDRKSDRQHDGGPVVVKHPFVSIIGGIQPACLNLFRESLRHGDRNDDGFMDRFLFACPPELPAVGERWMEVAPESLKTWENVIEKLLNLTMQGNPDDPFPHKVSLTDGGKQAWQDFTDRQAAERNEEGFPEILKGPWSKMEGYAARLALVVHFLHYAAGETGEEQVDGESMKAGANLVEYFKEHLKKVYALVELDPRTRHARRVLKSLQKESKARISKRDIWNPHRGTWKHCDDMESILKVLEKYGYIRREEEQPREGVGRRPSPMYQVHPSLLT